jgi:actin related protein 2/3 complex, subunit 1A/1B
MSISFNLSKLPIYDHCFTADRTHVAITQDNDVQIYNLSNPSKPDLVTTLKHHDKPVTAVDISSDGKIVTCSQDRNALVWIPQADGTYKETLVLLRINRAATCVKWCPNGTKFAVGSSARVISVCYFEEENDWWISKHIKRPIKSTILSLDWHENNVLLTAGSTDGHLRVFSTFIKGIDSKPATSIWGERLPFQTLCMDVNLSAWIQDVKFSPDFQFVAAVGHDSSVFVVYPGEGELAVAKIDKIKTSSLPFNSLIFANHSKIICAGFDCHPIVFEGSASQGWRQTYSIDDPTKKTVNVVENQSARNMFRQMDLKGSTSEKSSTLLTIHQNTITKLKPFQFDSNGLIRFSSSGNDGKVVIFDV